MIRKPGERILEIANAFRAIDGKKPEEKFSQYDVIALVQWLDDNFEIIESDAGIPAGGGGGGPAGGERYVNLPRLRIKNQ